MEVPICGEGYPGFAGHVGVGDVADDLLAAVLCERDMDYGSLAAEFDIFDGECADADLGSPEEVKVECDCVRLVLFAESCVEVLAHDG
jgi:hypothetical protein